MSDYYCPNCGADLEDQEGFDPEAGYWTCTSCGMMLTDPDVPSDDDGVAWFCDNCGAFLNKQEGFESWYSSWTCSECGHWNSLSSSEIYESEEAYHASKSSPDDEDDEYGYGEEWQFDHPRRCESCDRLLNKQDGFEEYYGSFTCTGCGWYNTWSTDSDDDDQSDKDRNETYSSDSENTYSYSSNTASSNKNQDSSSIRTNDNYTKSQPKMQKAKTKHKGIIEAFIEFYTFLLKASGVIFLIGLIITGGYFAYNGIDGLLNTIPIGKSSADFQGMQYDKAIQYLEKLGFENIEKKSIQDVTGKEIDKDGTVTTISVGGKTEFDESIRIPYNKKITVIYRTVIPVSVPLSYKAAKGMNHLEVEKLFRDAGFVNIRNDILYDIRLGWFNSEDEVEAVSVDGKKKYSEEIKYRPDTEVVISYHALKADKPKY